MAVVVACAWCLQFLRMVVAGAAQSGSLSHCHLYPASTATALPSPADALREVGEAERRERFSFALARTLDVGQPRLQQLLYSQVCGEGGWAGIHSAAQAPCCYSLVWLSFRLRQHMPNQSRGPLLLPPLRLPPLPLQDTAERLRAAEQQILEGRSYLAARSTLRDMF